VLKQNRYWHFDGETDPIKGAKGDTAFLRDNYKTMSIGSIFRTPKARFTPKQIQAGAKKAGFVVRVDQEGPWLKVTVTRRLPSKPAAPKKQDSYTGAGKVYPSVNNAPSNPSPDIFS
jgi:hypothetical protein